MTTTEENETVTTASAAAQSNSKASISLRVLAIIAVITVIYFAKMVLLPILIAGFIALFASPLVRTLESLYIPKPLASLLLEALLITIAVYISALLFEPALRWLEAAPLIGDRLAQGLENVSESLGVSDKTAVAVAGEPSAIERAMDSTLINIASMFAQTTIVLAVQTVAVVIIIYFFLVYGDDLMRNIVKAQETFSGKKLTVVMFQVIRDDVSMYILWVSLINVGLGLCTAGALALVGVDDALLWGALATILNYAPYVGPFILTAILTAIGFSSNEPLLQIVLAPGVFLVLNLIESQFVTPMVLGRRFNINPLLVVLWMFIWGWLWGVGGMLLAIPILMCLKLIFLHLRLIGAWVEVFNGNGHDDYHYAPSKNSAAGKKSDTLEKLTKIEVQSDV